MSVGRLQAMLPWDVRLQARYGFYTVYAVLTLAFALGVRAVPVDARPLAFVLVVFSDPSFLGFYFVAALVLFEKREGVLDAIVTSPLSTAAYVCSKALSLTLLALLATAVIAVLGYGPGVGWPALLGGVALTSTLFVFVGFVAVARFDSINAYFMTALAYMTVLGLPVFGVLGLFETPLYYLLPAKASLVLLRAAVETVPTWELVYAVGYLLLGNVVAFAAAGRAVDRHIVAGVTDHKAAGTPIGASVGGEYGPVASLALADLKNWLRDPLLVYIGLAPVLLGLVGRFGVPYAASALSDWVALAAYYPEITGLFVLFGPTIIGFAVGFFALEDREQGTLTALRLTPLTARGYLVYRGVVTLGAGFLAALVMVPLSGLVALPLATLVAVAAVASLYGAITALVLASLAANTVEGIAVSKFFGLSVIAPVAVVAVAPLPAQYLAGVLPAYWPLAALVRGVDGSGGVWALLAVGAAYQCAVCWLLVRRFLARGE
ncbi:ABC transporter permease [Haloarcula marina]|uniref:ABC transporter permease n=1 Tax=Haloarcula marina TaxID=2961574 RepID=UPI0020B81FDC|nr:ABC transporter permease [Halomicroarcula marina]